MNTMQEALLKAKVVSDEDVKRAERQKAVEREKRRKKRERKEARRENAKREKLKALASEWVQARHYAPKLAADFIASEVVEGLTSKEVKDLDVKSLEARLAQFKDIQKAIKLRTP